MVSNATITIFSLVSSSLMKIEKFEQILQGGHPNSLGRTIEVVAMVFKNPARLGELYNCCFSQDKIVRLRTSNALKRVSLEKPEWLVPYIDRLIKDIAPINQASTQWTLASLFLVLSSKMTPAQIKEAKSILKNNLENHHDWIVLNNTMRTLATWAEQDNQLKKWLTPQLTRLSSDKRKSVSNHAKKYIHRIKKYGQ